jgi:hypothetical protein
VEKAVLETRKEVLVSTPESCELCGGTVHPDAAYAVIFFPGAARHRQGICERCLSSLLAWKHGE